MMKIRFAKVPEAVDRFIARPFIPDLVKIYFLPGSSSILFHQKPFSFLQASVECLHLRMYSLGSSSADSWILFHLSCLHLVYYLA